MSFLNSASAAASAKTNVPFLVIPLYGYSVPAWHQGRKSLAMGYTTDDSPSCRGIVAVEHFSSLL